MLKNLIYTFKNKEILKIVLKPFLISILVSGVLIFLLSFLLYPFMKLILAIPFINNLLSGISFNSIMAYIFYQLTIMITSIVNAFFVEEIVRKLNDTFYKLPIKNTSIIEAIIWSLKGIGIFILIFPFTFFLLFIPFINILYQLFLWSILNKKSLIYDASSMFCKVKDVEKNLNKKIWILVFVSSVIYFIPVLNIFGYTFQLILLTHFILIYCKKGN